MTDDVETVADNGEGFCSMCSSKIRLNQIIYRTYGDLRSPATSVRHARSEDCKLSLHELKTKLEALSEGVWAARPVDYGPTGPCDYILMGPDLQVSECGKNDSIGICAMKAASPILVAAVEATIAMVESERALSRALDASAANPNPGIFAPQTIAVMNAQDARDEAWKRMAETLRKIQEYVP